MFARQGMSQSTRTPTLSQVRAVCIQREPTGRVIIVIVAEREDKREESRGREGEKKERARKTDREQERQRRAFSRYTRRRLERTHGGVLNLHTEGWSARQAAPYHTKQHKTTHHTPPTEHTHQHHTHTNTTHTTHHTPHQQHTHQHNTHHHNHHNHHNHRPWPV